MKILTINEGFSDNLGDQAIQYTLRKCLEELGAEVYFEDYSGSVMPANGSYKYTQSEIKNRNIRSYLPIPTSIKNEILQNYWRVKNFKRVTSAIKNANFDCIILGGGQMLQSNGVFPSMIDFWTKSIKKYSNAKVLFWGVGIGSNLEGKDVEMVKRSLKRADAIYVRDKYSKYIGEIILGHEINHVPDIVFTIDDYIPNSIRNKSKRVLVGIPSQTHLLNKSRSFYSKMATKTNKWSFEDNDDMPMLYNWWADNISKYRSKGYDVGLFYTTMADFIETNKLKKYYFSKYNDDLKILSYTSLEELLDEIKKSEIIISGRMHALILGFVYGCKLEPFIFSQKIQSFCDEYIVNKQDIKAIKNEIKLKLKEEIYR